MIPLRLRKKLRAMRGKPLPPSTPEQAAEVEAGFQRMKVDLQELDEINARFREHPIAPLDRPSKPERPR